MAKMQMKEKEVPNSAEAIKMGPAPKSKTSFMDMIMAAPMKKMKKGNGKMPKGKGC